VRVFNAHVAQKCAEYAPRTGDASARGLERPEILCESSLITAADVWPEPCLRQLGMSQKSVEIMIGRLITDESLRADFQVDPVRSLRAMESAGLELNPAEFAALVEMPVAAWAAMAAWIHPRLQKVALKGDGPAVSRDSLSRVDPK